MTRFFLAPVLLIGLAGCETTSSQDEVGLDLGAVAEARPLGPVAAPPGSILNSADVTAPAFLEATKAMVTEAGPALQAATEAIRSDRPLAAKHAAVQAAFGREMRREARWWVVANAGNDMLDLLLAHPDAPPEMLAVYTRQLAENGDPNADVLLEGLRRAAPALASDEAREIARAIQTSAEAYLDPATRCPDCGGDAELASQMAGRRADIASALPSVDQMRAADSR